MGNVFVWLAANKSTVLTVAIGRLLDELENDTSFDQLVSNGSFPPMFGQKFMLAYRGSIIAD